MSEKHKTYPKTSLKMSVLLFSVLTPSILVAQNAEEMIETVPATEQQKSVTTYDYYVVNQRIPDFLNVLSRDVGFRVDVSEKVRGRISGKRVSGSIDGILNKLSRSHQIEWFEFNDVYYFSASEESATRLVRLGNLPIKSARTVLESTGLPFDRYPIRDAANDRAIILSGPPKLLGLAEAIIESIPEDAPVTSRPVATIKVRRGSEAGIQISQEQVSENE